MQEPTSVEPSTPDETPFPNGAFVRYLIGEGISITGSWMQAMAAGWVVAGLTTSATMLALVNLISGIPMIALSTVGGLFADKFDKRMILQVCQVVQIILSLYIGYLISVGQLELWHIFVTTFLGGLSAAFEMPAASALVPELVGRAHVARAIAVDRAVFHGTRLIGPALAGYLVGRYGPASTFYINATTFLALMIALLTLPPRPKGTAEQEEKRQHGMGEGFRHVLKDSPSFAMILLMATNTVFVFPMMVILLPLYAKNVLVISPQEMGFLMLSSGLGSLTGSLGVLRVKRSWRPKVIATAVAIICCALFSLSLANTFLWAAGTLVCLALGVSSLIALSNTVVQERAPDEIRGRVAAVAGLSFFGLLPFAGMIMAAVADWIDIRHALLYSSCCYAFIGIIVLWWAGDAAGEEISPTQA